MGPPLDDQQDVSGKPDARAPAEKQVAIGCIFCRIARRELDAHIVYEDDEHVAFLDRFPNTPGMTLLIPRRHVPSYVFDMDPTSYSALFLAARRLAQRIDGALAVQRTALVMEGTGINHAHLKLYPLHGLRSKDQECWAPQRAYFETYQGYLTTQMGPEIDPDLARDLTARLQRAPT